MPQLKRELYIGMMLNINLVICGNTFINYLYFLAIEDDKIDFTLYRTFYDKYGCFKALSSCSTLYEKRIKEGVTLDELKEALKSIREDSKTIEDYDHCLYYFNNTN